MQDKIIAAIAAYLEKETKVTGFRNNRHRVEFGGSINHGHFTHAGFCQEIATEIYTAIAPLATEKDLQLSELFTHMSEQHNLTLTDTELGDIIHVARGK